MKYQCHHYSENGKIKLVGRPVVFQFVKPALHNTSLRKVCLVLLVEPCSYLNRSLGFFYMLLLAGVL